ncbi:GNAT family N-acetyltransferase [Actinoplanes sp. RD1]|uniref:GNAT family N-acetyltransferase n=1 Tax=Actinoplanes sp. RD1 TaxID=3064538 RepID=UPI0027417854|nr:GNAT family N-acetyltransferase [Actinoplanes sp. RD1]
MPDLGPVAWPPAPIRTERLVLRQSEARDRATFLELSASPEVSAYLGGPQPRDELERTLPGVPGRRPGVFVVELAAPPCQGGPTPSGRATSTPSGRDAATLPGRDTATLPGRDTATASGGDAATPPGRDTDAPGGRGPAIGTVMLERRNLGPRDRVRPERGEVDLGYLFLPEAWGHGYAAEACAAALAWFDGALPGEPVVLCTQTANLPSMRLAARLGFGEVQRFEAFGAEQWFGMRPPRR